MKQLSTKQVWQEFRAGLQLTADGLRRAAVAYVELVERGEDLSAYASPLILRLPDIASGKILPDVLVRYGADRAIVGAISTLVPEEQAKLVGPNATVLVAKRVDGRVQTTTRRALDLTVAEIKQVFADGHIRTPSQQRAHLPAQAPTPAAPEPSPHVDAWDALALLSHNQRGQVATQASKAGMTPAEFVVDLLIRHKVITETKVLASRFRTARRGAAEQRVM